MSHLVCNGELTKTRRNCLCCSWTSASSAWVFLRRSWVTHKLQKIAPQLLGRLVGLLFFWSCNMTLGSSSPWRKDLSCTAATFPPLIPWRYRKMYVKLPLNHCWSFPLGFLPHIESTLPQGKNPMPRLEVLDHTPSSPIFVVPTNYRGSYKIFHTSVPRTGSMSAFVCTHTITKKLIYRKSNEHLSNQMS